MQDGGRVGNQNIDNSAYQSTIGGLPIMYLVVIVRLVQR